MLSGLRRRFKRDSLDDEDDTPFNDSTSQAKKSRKPPNTAFRQQRLNAWQPILVPKVVLPMLLAIAIACIPIGIGFLYVTYNIQMIEINYSKCEDTATSSFSKVPSKYYSYHFKGGKSSDIQWKLTSDDNDVQTCTLQFTVPNDIDSHISLYYKLTNFYQNHRKYVESYDWQQLKGKAIDKDDLSTYCKPMKIRDEKAIYPCGLVANSMFNDTISNLNPSETNEYVFETTGIAWSSDKSLYKTSEYNVSDIVPPENWLEKYPNGYNQTDLENIAKDERFMNWMRTAGLPSFYKLHGKSDTKLTKGTYTMEIELHYPVSIFGGTKSVALSTSSVIGGRHMGLGICFLIVGGISVVFMLVFMVKQIFTKKQSDHAFLEGLNEGPADHGHSGNPEDEVLRQIL